jgi:hypothetical protein
VTLYVFDDCAMSGTQSIHTFEEWLGARALKPYHTRHAVAVTDPTRFRCIPIRVVFAVATDYALSATVHRLRELGFEDVKVLYGALDPLSQKPFSPAMCYIWRSLDERDRLRATLEEIGETLLERRAAEKQWAEKRRHESALGYSGFQRLLVFEHNVPKTTITALWERGHFQGTEWRPLFPGAD